jgi:ZIP family zinc transporter
VVVASAVLAHDFSDGINTVSFIMKNGGSRRTALTWLLVDAAAPVVGIFATMFVTVSESDLSILLSLFAGFFLYIGASDLLPESHHAHPKAWTTISSLLGIAALYAVISLAGV